MVYTDSHMLVVSSLSLPVWPPLDPGLRLASHYRYRFPLLLRIGDGLHQSGKRSWRTCTCTCSRCTGRKEGMFWRFQDTPLCQTFTANCSLLLSPLPNAMGRRIMYGARRVWKIWDAGRGSLSKAIFVVISVRFEPNSRDLKNLSLYPKQARSHRQVTVGTSNRAFLWVKSLFGTRSERPSSSYRRPYSFGFDASPSHRHSGWALSTSTITSRKEPITATSRHCMRAR